MKHKITKVGRCFQRHGRKICTSKSVQFEDERILSVRTIVWDWRCAHCGRGMTELVDDVICPNCGSHEVVRHEEARRQRQELREVAQGLPAELQAAAGLQKGPSPKDTANALWGTGRVLRDVPNEEEQERWRKMDEDMTAKGLLLQED